MIGMKGRYEIKHAISKAECVLLRKHLSQFMALDSNGIDGKYVIRSVYFDNFENRIFTQKTEGLYHRDKFRIRLYNNNMDFMNLEKKSKRDNLTFKKKCRITKDEYEKIRFGDIGWMSTDDRELIQELYMQINLYQLKPTTVVDYEREVYTYPYGNVRITFDSNVKTGVRNTDIVNEELIMVDAMDQNIVILEVKYDEFIPDVIKYLLQVIDTRKTGFSKYQLSRRYS